MKRELEEILSRYAETLPGKLGAGVRDLMTGEEAFLNADVPFPSASVFKVPVLAALFQRAEDGALNLDDPYVLREDDLAPGSGVLSLLTPGLTMRVRDYAMLMMIISDNTGADVCHRLAGLDAIRKTIAGLGLSGTTAELTCRQLVLGLFKDAPEDMPMAEYLRRADEDSFDLSTKLYDDPAIPNDATTPRDMVRFFTMLCKGEVVSPAASRGMMEIMGRCQTNSRIPCLLPDEGPKKAKVIHKTGTLPWVTNDCGIVLSGGHAYALALFHNSFGAAEADRESANRADRALAELSRDIFAVMTASRPAEK